MNNTTAGVDEGEWVYVTLKVTSAILFTIGFPGNLIIIYLVSKHQHLKNATNYFVSSLAIADLFVLVSMLFWIIGIELFPHDNVDVKYIYSSLDIWTGILSMLNVFCVSADRAIAVTYPLRYERIVTKRRSLIITITIMCYSLCLLVLGIVRSSNPSVPDKHSKVPVINTYHRVVDYICYGNFFIAILGTIICYTLIFLIVFHKLKGSRKLERLMSSTRYAFNEESGDQEISQEKKRSRSILFREIKVTVNIMIIVFPFTAGWTFFIGTNVYEDNFGYVKNITYNIFMIIVPWLLSVLNPVIYLMVNRQLRQTFCKTIKKRFQGRERPFLDESRLSILASLSRRASSTRTSSTVDGSELINVPLRNVRKSQMALTNSARSSASMDRSAFESVPLAS